MAPRPRSTATHDHHAPTAPRCYSRIQCHASSIGITGSRASDFTCGPTPVRAQQHVRSRVAGNAARCRPRRLRARDSSLRLQGGGALCGRPRATAPRSRQRGRQIETAYRSAGSAQIRVRESLLLAAVALAHRSVLPLLVEVAREPVRGTVRHDGARAAGRRPMSRNRDRTGTWQISAHCASQWTSAESAWPRRPASQPSIRVRARSITEFRSSSAISHQ